MIAPADADDVLEDGPAEEQVIGLGRSWSSAAPGDVDHDDARGHRHREPQQRGRGQRRGRATRKAAADAVNVTAICTGAAQSTGRVLAPKLADVDLDADLEQQEDRPDLGEQADLSPIGDVAGGERRDGEPDRQVADDRRQAQPPREPACSGCGEEDRSDLENGDGRVLHGRDGTGRARWNSAGTAAISSAGLVPGAVGPATDAFALPALPGLVADRAARSPVAAPAALEVGLVALPPTMGAEGVQHGPGAVADPRRDAVTAGRVATRAATLGSIGGGRGVVEAWGRSQA